MANVVLIIVLVRKRILTSDDIVRLVNEDTCAAAVAFSPKKCYLPIICLEVVV